MASGSGILIVDDDANVRAALSTFFEQDRCPHVRTAQNLEEAIREARALPWEYPSVVILDLVLPGADLDELIAGIRASAPGSIAIIGLSPIWLGKRPAIDAILVGHVDPATLRREVMRQLTDIRARKVLELAVYVLGFDRLARPHHTAVVTGASACFVETDRRRFLLTAGHVVEAIDEKSLRWMIGGEGNLVSIDGWSRLAIDPDADIGTVAVPDSFDPNRISRRFYHPSSWPPERARVAEPAIFVGFPGEHRVLRPGVVEAHGTVLTDFVSSVSTRFFVLSSELKREVIGSGPRSSLRHVGGISGAPVFVSREYGLVLVGAVSQGMQPSSDIVSHPTGADAAFVASHADFIEEDGTLDENLPR